jgi:hypothetical protein
MFVRIDSTLVNLDTISTITVNGSNIIIGLITNKEIIINEETPYKAFQKYEYIQSTLPLLQHSTKEQVVQNILPVESIKTEIPQLTSSTKSFFEILFPDFEDDDDTDY